MKRQMDSEIGRELTATELKPRSVVVIGVGEADKPVRMWVTVITPNSVEFYSCTSNITLLARRRGDELYCLNDALNPVQLHVYEFTGQV